MRGDTQGRHDVAQDNSNQAVDFGEGVPGGVLMPFVFHRQGDGFGGVSIHEAGDEGERHVDTGRDTGGSRELAVLDPASLLDPVDGRALADDPCKGALVGGGAEAVEKTGAGEEGSSGAYG